MKNEVDNSQFQFIMAVVKNIVVGHISRPVSRLIFHFLSRDGHVDFHEVIGNCPSFGISLGIKVLCIFQFYGGERHTDRLNSLLHDIYKFSIAIASFILYAVVKLFCWSFYASQIV